MSLEFRNIAFSYGEKRALDSVDLHAPAGQITCLLGSSGCGKTTLLNLAAGLVRLQQGSIHLDGQLLADPRTSPPPERRSVGLVFQEHALFPHLTVAENIAFGLGRRRDRAAVAESWLRTIGLADCARRYPGSLSGGQQQRVALARAMAPEPAVLLMDEPFASVDIVLRRSLRRECRRLLKERGATAIMVTHDPEEATDMGDRIAMMEAGRIVQAGTPGELYDTPVSAKVGAMFGDAQIVRARLAEDGLRTAFGIWPLACLAPGRNTNRGVGGSLDLLVRSASLRFSPGGDGLRVEEVRRNGGTEALELANDAGERLTVEHMGRTLAEVGSRFAVVPADGSVFPFDRTEEEA